MTGIYYYTCDKSGVYKRMTRHNEDSFVVVFSIIICKNLTITHGFGCRQGISLKQLMVTFVVILRHVKKDWLV